MANVNNILERLRLAAANVPDGTDLDLSTLELLLYSLKTNTVQPLSGGQITFDATTVLFDLTDLVFDASVTTFTGTSMNVQSPLVCEDELVLQQVGTVAAAGTNQATAGVASGNPQSIIVTGADGTKGVKVFVNAQGDLRFYFNQSSASLKIYPATGGTINAGSTNDPITIAPNSLAIMLCMSETAWTALYVPVNYTGTSFLVNNSLGSIGYTAGAGSSVTQTGSITDGVALDQPSGRITTVASTLGAGAEAVFTVSSNSVQATDGVVLSTTYAGAGTPHVYCKRVGTNAFDICIANLHAADALNAVVIINYQVIKGSIT